MIVVGVDPGAQGAFYRVSSEPGRPVVPLDYLLMPMVDVGKRIKDVDVPPIKRWLLENRPDLVVVEEVGYMPASGRQGHAMSGFGETILAGRYNQLIGMLKTLEIPYQPVKPQSWQKGLDITVSSSSRRRVGALDKKKALKPKESREARQKRVKAAVRAYVERRYPSAALVPPGCRVPQEGLVDALAVAVYGTRLLVVGAGGPT